MIGSAPVAAIWLAIDAGESAPEVKPTDPTTVSPAARMLSAKRSDDDEAPEDSPVCSMTTLAPPRARANSPWVSVAEIG